MASVQWLRANRIAQGRRLKLYAWSLAGVLVGAVYFSAIYYHLVTPLGVPPTYLHVFLWDFFSLAPWVLLAPRLILTTEYLHVHDIPKWRVWLTHALTLLAILIVLGVWFTLVSMRISPYVTYLDPVPAFGGYVRGFVTLHIVTYVILVVGTSAMLSQRALAESERLFRAVFENAVVGIFRSTPAGRITMLNPSGARQLGYDSPEQAMSGISDLSREVYVDPADRDAYLAAIRRDGYVSDWLVLLKRPDGTVRWHSENARGVFDGAGKLRYLEGTVKDVTDEVTAREALRESERRAAELRVQLADASLRALKLQLRPHFLFNILNTVAMMIRSGETAGAQRVVTLLGDMFRRFLEFEGEDTLPLSQELDFLDLYLELEQFRFEGRMELHRRIDADTLSLPVPTLILQPIVENAVKHGVARIPGRCRIDLTARREDGVLVIEVVNDAHVNGALTGKPGHGIGVSNTRSRLRETYGGRGSFELFPDGGRVRAVLRLPACGVGVAA